MSTASPLFLVSAIKFFCLLYVATSTESTNDTIGRRFKREFEAKYLVFPQGSNIQLVYCLTMSTYTKPSGLFTLGITAGQAWELPSESTISADRLDVYHRRSRRELYRKMESLLGTQGKDGRACILKAICRAARRNRTETRKGAFLEEIMNVVFSLPGKLDDADTVTEYEKAYYCRENCGEMEERCPDAF